MSLSESESSLVWVVVHERWALLIVAYSLMEAEEVSELIDLLMVPELDSEEEVVELAAALEPEVGGC